MVSAEKDPLEIEFSIKRASIQKCLPTPKRNSVYHKPKFSRRKELGLKIQVLMDENTVFYPYQSEFSCFNLLKELKKLKEAEKWKL